MTMIYKPAGQALEYAPLATNPYRGCGHGCAYCWVPLITKQPREEFNAGAVERNHYLRALRREAAQLRAAGVTDQVLLSFTTDPYHPGDTRLTRQTIKVLHEHGLGVCTLTKGGTRALRDLDLLRRDGDAFASTLTSLDATFSRKWEPCAADPEDRLTALRQYHDAGIFTWVSLEPTLDCDVSLKIIRETHSYVDLYKIGRVNYQPMTRIIDWRDYTLRIIELCQKLQVQHYIKKDLQGFLPSDYHNPLRVTQHH